MVVAMYLPAAQSMHAVAPLLGWDFPAGQLGHSSRRRTCPACRRSKKRHRGNCHASRARAGGPRGEGLLGGGAVVALGGDGGPGERPLDPSTRWCTCSSSCSGRTTARPGTCRCTKPCTPPHTLPGVAAVRLAKESRHRHPPAAGADEQRRARRGLARGAVGAAATAVLSDGAQWTTRAGLDDVALRGAYAVDHAGGAGGGRAACHGALCARGAARRAVVVGGALGRHPGEQRVVARCPGGAARLAGLAVRAHVEELLAAANAPGAARRRSEGAGQIHIRRADRVGLRRPARRLALAGLDDVVLRAGAAGQADGAGGGHATGHLLPVVLPAAQ